MSAQAYAKGEWATKKYYVEEHGLKPVRELDAKNN